MTKTIQDEAQGLISDAVRLLERAGMFVCGDLREPQKPIMISLLKRARRDLDAAIVKVSALEVK